MDYFKQRRAYRDFKVYEAKISEGQNNLYRELLDYANDKRRLDQNFRLTNDVLVKLTGLSLNGLVQSRKKLVELNLIEYTKGKRNSDAPSYKIVKLYDDFGGQGYNPESEISNSQGNQITNTWGNNVKPSGQSFHNDVSKSSVQPSKVLHDNPESKKENTWGNRSTNSQGNQTANSQGEKLQTLGVTNHCTSTITNSLTNTKHHHHDSETIKDIDDENTKTENYNFKELITYFQQNIGVTTPILVQQLCESVNDFTEQGTSESEAIEIVKYAIRLTVENGVRRWKYTNKILMNWINANLFTLANIKASNNARGNKSTTKSFVERSAESAKKTGLGF